MKKQRFPKEIVENTKEVHQFASSYRSKVIFIILLVLFVQCGAIYHKIPLAYEKKASASNEFTGLVGSVEEIINAGGNHYRKKVILERLSDYGLYENTRQERIDWLSVQKNIIVEIPGKSDSLIYLVAHYDKADLNPLKITSIYLNGWLDPLISWSYTTQGAIDNTTGVAVALQLAKSLSERVNEYSYRILLAGSEESGLRGSRTHVARLYLEESDKIKFVVNVEVFGVKGKQNCVYKIS